MRSKEYKKKILELFLEKHNSRIAKKVQTNKRIQLLPKDVYKDYEKNNANIEEKRYFNEAVAQLKSYGFVTAELFPMSDDIKKLYFVIDSVDDVYQYMKEEYGIKTKNENILEIERIISAYENAGDIAKTYCNNLLRDIEDIKHMASSSRIEANLKMISFLSSNQENLYIREASMLVYGDSKWFEDNNLEEVSSIIRNILEMQAEEDERKDAVFERFHVYPTEQEIWIKGDWKIEWDGYILETKGLDGGIAISSADARRIKRVTVNSSVIMTIENKTSFRRMNASNIALVDLGGFANRQQIEFIKRINCDNSNVRYLHFGDIDVGGLLIHRHLCKTTGIDFEMYCMGIQELEDIRYRDCLKEISEKDRTRLEPLLTDSRYSEVANYLMENGVKLEQEIISYHLSKVV